MSMFDSSSLVIGSREIWAALGLLAWLSLCWMTLGRRASTVPETDAANVDWLVLYASQSGNAQRIAEQLATSLGGADKRIRLMSLNQLQPESLPRYSRALLVISTYGEGEAPDNGAGFWRKAQHAPPDLRALNYALLALGDSRYTGFCAFAHQLSQWLIAAGAQPMLALQKVDQLNAAALHEWQRQLSTVTGREIALGDNFSRWTLLERRLLNPDSPGPPAWLIRLQAVAAMPTWDAGDLAQVRIDGLLRSYSIASLPEDGVLELIVRQVVHPDGSLGRASGWLCQHAKPGAQLDVQLLTNPRFHLPESSVPLILIGAGTGLAGLRGVLRRSQQRGQRANWLIFGERCAVRDRWLSDELEPLVEEGMLNLDRCFSRPPDQREYVQHRLQARADQLRQWVDQGACIHVCGSLAGMGSTVHLALQELLTTPQWQDLQQHNRYRRDLY
jgi:sulfite reductase (NADPH) flavoprotein alpha-component